ncbi:AIM24 family protein [Streptomyces sp. SID3343]|uniref:AIM24 family protein n=1 Tax=Streptomyces sp. SID3343 TaxID=2690260 RepID=UPI00136C4293|nr:AIM24 family protein [Streptomyces sp. SID3343]MYW03577.1 AIM24 family protein [Streptomyces sp. SID3343]
MQSSLFGHAPQQTAERFSLQNPHMLKVQLGNGQPDHCLARVGSMVAYQGAIDFDGNMRGGAEQRAARATGEQLNLMRAQGTGTMWLANMAQSIHVLDLDFEGLCVDGQYVLALDSSLSWNVVAIESAQEVAGAGSYNLDISGSGKVAIMTSGKPLVMRVQGGEAFADADAVVAWSSRLQISMQAQTTSQRIYSRRRGTGESWDMVFRGEGYVVVQPSELLPPPDFITASGLMGSRGLGAQGGVRGNTWGS